MLYKNEVKQSYAVYIWGLHIYYIIIIATF